MISGENIRLKYFNRELRMWLEMIKNNDMCILIFFNLVYVFVHQNYLI